MSDRLVVMRNGRIEQIGSPAEIYDAPSTLWVAGFVGASSSMEGRIVEVGEHVAIDTPYGLIVAGHRHGAMAPGGRATVIVRPEDIGLASAPPAPGTPNHCKVVVEELLNIGHNVKVVAKQSDGTQIMAHVRRADAAALALLPGATTWLTFEASSVHAYPPAGPEA